MAKLPPKIGAAFTKPAGAPAAPTAVVTTKKVRTTLDMEKPFHTGVQKWMGERQAASGRRVNLTRLVHELLREITGQALGADATDDERAALAELQERVLRRVTS